MELSLKPVVGFFLASDVIGLKLDMTTVAQSPIYNDNSSVLW